MKKKKKRNKRMEINSQTQLTQKEETIRYEHSSKCGKKI